MNVWSDAVVSRLQRLSYEGYSGSMIAEAVNKEFGCSFTRNAVIGKLRRLGCTAGGKVVATPTRWTDPMIEALRLSFADGNTAQTCARHVSAVAGFTVTASAIHAKAGAMGMNFKAKAREVFVARLFNPPPRPILFTAPIEDVDQAEAVSIVPPLAPEPPPVGEPVSLMALRPHHCRWDAGRDEDGHMLYCGARKVKGSYCAKHARMAYLPKAKRTAKAPLPQYRTERAFARFA